MRKFRNRLISFLCAIGVLMSPFGNMDALAAPSRQKPITLTKKLTATDGRNYEITASFAVDVPGEWDEEADGAYPDSLHIALAAQELSASSGSADGWENTYAEYVDKAAEALEQSVEELRTARVFDISLYNSETGEEIQPESSVNVSIRLLDDDLGRYETVSVVHIHDDGQEQAEVMDCVMQGEAVKFKTDGFSVYVLTGTTYLCTYYFFSYNSFGEYQGYTFYDTQGNPVSSQTIGNGERLLAPYDVPGNPNVPGAEFKGWYVGDRGC